MNAQSTATDAKASAPASLLAKGKKVAGKAGLAEALLSGSRKGSISFARIMSGKISAKPGEKTGGGNLGSSLAAALEGLKSAAHAVPDPRATAYSPYGHSGPAMLNPRAATKRDPRAGAAQPLRGEKASNAKLPSGLLEISDETEKQALGKEGKSDGRKKTAGLIVHNAGVTAEAGMDKSNTAELAAAPKHIEAPVAQTQNAARADAMPHTVAVHVVDLRTRTSQKSSDAGVQKIAQTAPAAKEPGALFVPQQSAPRDIEIPRKAASASAAAPQAGLERLREMAGSELIRATNLVLRDGGGEIRLVLKPESLGSVRIRMNLVDNKIEGRIIVDSSAVKQVMDQSIDALSRALTAAGFQTASLEVSVGGQNADNGRQMQEPPEEMRRVAAQGFERNIPMEESLSMGDLLVNLFV